MRLYAEVEMTKKVELSAEERAQLVLRFLSREDSAANLGRRVGISEQTLYRWRDEFIAGGKQALNGAGMEKAQAKELARLSAQVAERDRVIGELTITNRVLKKISGSSS
jgi:transposase-like protein